jgi:hypothetical protein
MIRASYNEAACLDAYRALKADPRNPGKVERALELTLPILNCVLCKHFSRFQPGSEAYDEAVSSTVIKLYNYLTSDRFYERYYDEPKTHFSLLFTICRSEVITAINKVRRYENFDSTGMNPPPLYENSPTALEHRIYVKELPEHILAEVVSKIRFTGLDRDLCAFLAEKLVNGKGVPVTVVRKRWGTRNLKFFAEYVRVLIRAVLYELKPSIDKLPVISDLGFYSVLNSEQDMFTEGWHTGNNEVDWWLGCDTEEEV